MTDHMTAADPGLLTPAEHEAVRMAADLWGHLQRIVTDGAARKGDLDELCFHIHGIQRAVLKQAAARAYPELYRLLGGDPPPGPGTSEADPLDIEDTEPRWWYLPDPIVDRTPGGRR